MTRHGVRIHGVICGVVVLVLALLAGCGGADDAAPGATPIRIGYPVTTLINGQVGQVFIKTDVLQQSGLAGEVVPFTSGPPANEAMAAGDIDVQLTSEGPAVQSALQGVGSTVVGTLGTTRDAIIARPDRGIGTVADLRGKSIGVPFGTTPFLHMVQALEKAGLNPDTDVKLINIPANELAGAFTAGNVDAVAYNEPLPTQLEAVPGGATIVSTDELVYAVLARTAYLKENPEAVERFLVATARSLGYLVAHKEQVNGWFAEVSRASPEVIEAASRRSPFYTAGTPAGQLDLGIDDALVARLQTDVDFFAELGAKPTIPIADSVDREIWPRAKQRLVGTERQPVSVPGP